jgi:hypothetical protein
VHVVFENPLELKFIKPPPVYENVFLTDFDGIITESKPVSNVSFPSGCGSVSSYPI